ncbi:ABC transporter substrate-binding protein [Treponema phagedenis]|uniref:Sugar ABC transporter substrate-binding protein n=1 Tax=Treponema phagedenis TaxID=162 RepID=A0AAE6M7A2_TREPH|nr:sugar ABC transporter substrate-binding protein [Treponema phagedenis]NVP23681.1 sugar ABC transporter substrate-binding protein [Treponema phagedenis]QEJ97560.1 sugar ABC transporter substrate-binding protein [Treponema phagedenis]QEK03127.1 sugar ABC transporter substrate-binding protein [Treponema phagedenis]QEK08753.1 sugar ABC transporter substrate-binding protein [Treponema phagedenis]QLC58505.1 sugar ABC transporter substrate-binding protein [Treponema phagedenis]
MKKITHVLFMFLAITGISFIGGCAKEQNDNTITLTFVEVMTSPSRTAQLQKIIADYQKLHPNIKINLISPPYEQADNKLTMMLNSNQALDIVEVRDHTIKTYVNNAKLHDLSDYISKWDDRSDLLPLAVAASKTVDDTPYLIPQFFYIKGLFIRTDILKKHGYTKMPTTIEEMYKISKEITQKTPGQYGFCFRGKGDAFKTSDMLIFADIPNVSVDNIYTTTDGKYVLDNPAGKQALTDYAELFKKAVPADGINWGFNEQINAFVSGSTVFLVQDPDTVSLVSEHLTEEQYTVIPMPIGKSSKSYLDYGFAGLSIPKTSKHPNEAWDFIAYISSAKVNAEFCKEYGPLPIMASAYKNDPHFSTGLYKAWNTEMTTSDTYVFAKYPLDSEKYPGWSQVEQQGMQAFLIGEKTVDETIDMWKKYWQK